MAAVSRTPGLPLSCFRCSKPARSQKGPGAGRSRDQGSSAAGASRAAAELENQRCHRRLHIPPLLMAFPGLCQLLRVIPLHLWGCRCVCLLRSGVAAAGRTKSARSSARLPMADLGQEEPLVLRSGNRAWKFKPQSGTKTAAGLPAARAPGGVWGRRLTCGALGVNPGSSGKLSPVPTGDVLVLWRGRNFSVFTICSGRLRR